VRAHHHFVKGEPLGQNPDATAFHGDGTFTDNYADQETMRGKAWGADPIPPAFKVGRGRCEEIRLSDRNERTICMVFLFEVAATSARHHPRWEDRKIALQVDAPGPLR